MPGASWRALGIEAHFAAVHDITACDYRPKPDPSGYRVMIERYGIDAEPAAHGRGHGAEPAAGGGHGHDHGLGPARNPTGRAQGAEPEHIHHVIDELGPWLAAARRPAGAG